MLADNIVILKNKMPELYQKLVDWEKSGDETHVIVEETKDGLNTLKYDTGENSLYIHSKYNPLREATTLIDKLKIEKDSSEIHVFFYGLGMGYHIELFIETYPHVSYSVIEPSYEVMIKFLENRKIDKIINQNLVCLQVGSDSRKLFELVNKRYDKELKFLELPVYPKIFKNEFTEFFENFKNSIRYERMVFGATAGTDKRWIRNIIMNFKALLKTPNILHDHNDIFTGKPAILVSAGPSLNFEIESLKKIKEDGSAFIFTVGSAINTLILHGIYPDAMCTYDPHEVNQQVFEKINELKIDSIPMIFGSSVGFEVLDNYNGPKYHMLMAHDVISKYFIIEESIAEVHDAPTVAIVTMELLAKLGFDRIILVGQNLGYLKDATYAEGISYAPEKAKKTQKIEDVEGNIIESPLSFVLMKENMERMISLIDQPVINTTRGGAKILGTQFRYLDELIENDFSKKVVHGDEFNRILGESLFHKEILEQKLIQLFDALNVYNGILIDTKKLLNQLGKIINTNNKQEIIDTNIRISNLINSLEANQFFKLIALQMNRASYKLALNKKDSLKNERNDIVIIKKTFKSKYLLIERLLSEKELNQILMEELRATISDY
ncbi:DUF115 domain-containing protein [Eubacteriaceae bacterium ES2]|nr:DUF115 domain-containing protein [Eubacteriaceae bacterium ES2]